MKTLQQLARISVVALGICLILSITSWGQQSLSNADSSSDKASSSGDKASDSSSANQDATQTSRDTSAAQQRDSTRSERAGNNADAARRQQDPTNRERFEAEPRDDDSGAQVRRRFDSDSRREQDLDRADDTRFQTLDDRFESRDDRFESRDDRFESRDDRFESRDDRSQRDRFENRDRTRVADTDARLGASLRVNNEDQLVVSNLSRSGLLARAGIRDDDVIMSVDGNRVSSEADLERRITQSESGERIPLVVMRNGERQTIFLDSQRGVVRDRSFYPDDYRQFDGDRAWLGVYLDARYTDHAVVEAVQVGSTADEIGLQAGDWIVGVNGQRVSSPAHLSRMIRAMEPGEDVRLQISRRVTRELDTRLGERPENRSRFRYDDGSGAVSGRFEQRGDRIERRSYRGESQFSPYAEGEAGERRASDGRGRDRIGDRPIAE